MIVGVSIAAPPDFVADGLGIETDRAVTATATAGAAAEVQAGRLLLG